MRIKLPLTAERVAEYAADIRVMAGDPEAAHTCEDLLWRYVLEAVCGGHPESSKLAEEALKTCDIDFPRWCA